MDYGTPTSLPWGVVYTHPASYAPVDGVVRHPVQFYELAGDLVIAGVLLKLRGKLPDGALFLSYLVLFGALRFALFFFRGDVPAVALGFANGHWDGPRDARRCRSVVDRSHDASATARAADLNGTRRRRAASGGS